MNEYTKVYRWCIFRLGKYGLEIAEWSNSYGYMSEEDAEQAIIDNNMTYIEYFILKNVKVQW